MTDLFEERSLNYNLRYNNNIMTRNIHSVKYGIDTISYLGPKIWDSLPQNLKTAPNVIAFKREIKSWVPMNCPCKLCKQYVAGVGYVNTY